MESFLSKLAYCYVWKSSSLIKPVHSWGYRLLIASIFFQGSISLGFALETLFSGAKKRQTCLFLASYSLEKQVCLNCDETTKKMHEFQRGFLL